MGIEIPGDTKLSDSSLIKKLDQALNSAQSVSTLNLPASFNPSALRVWSQNSQKPALEAIRRGNFAEAMQNVAASSRGTEAFPLYKNAFIDLRQTLMHLAKQWDNKNDVAIIQDAEQDHAICVRVSGAILFVCLLLSSTDCYCALAERYHSCYRAPLRSSLSFYAAHVHFRLHSIPSRERSRAARDQIDRAGANIALDFADAECETSFC